MMRKKEELKAELLENFALSKSYEHFNEKKGLHEDSTYDSQKIVYMN